ncbi:class I SAM-dependent methyltransferase [Patescibacteria group bacterium]|nr:class I SAM-dependent methyltransferase [Patescibacteria group bacterium]
MPENIIDPELSGDLAREEEGRKIKEINLLLGNPNYSETQLNIHQGRERVFPTAGELKERLGNLWWVKVMKDSTVQDKLSKLFDASYVSLFVSEDEKSNVLKIARDLRVLYFAAADARGNDPDSTQTKVKEVKDKGLPVDDEGRLIYDYKAMRDKSTPGYGSFQWGMVPEKTAALLGFTSEELDGKRVLIAGMGTGDIARYSFSNLENVFGVDLSSEMIEWVKERGLQGTAGNISQPDTLVGKIPEKFAKPDIAVADYFLDVTEAPVTALRELSRNLPEGGRLMITILIPIHQQGADSKLVTEGEEEIASTKGQSIGNTGNPWSDVLKLKEVCGDFGFDLERFSVTSYVQFDSGRQADPMPGEIRPSGIFVFKKK